MRPALLAFAILPATSVAAPPLPPAKPCKAEAQIAKQRGPVRIRPLSEMPPAKQVLGVYREVDGCAEPIVVRERVGLPPRR